MKRGLGKGLSALMADAAEGRAENMGVHEVDIFLIDNDAGQPRKKFDKEKLNELAQSIKIHGIMQPIVVYPSEGRYTIIAGERRFRAAKIAGLNKIPVIIKELDKRGILELSLIENIQREDLNPMEQSAALYELMMEYGLTQDEVARRVGKSRSAIANLLRLRSLPDRVKKLVENEKLSAGHARCLLPLEDEKRITDAAKTIVEKELSVREAEALVKELMDPAGSQPKTAKKPKKLPVEMREAQDELSNILATKVQLTGNRQKGRISISYYSAEQLNELYEALRKI